MSTKKRFNVRNTAKILTGLLLLSVLIYFVLPSRAQISPTGDVDCNSELGSNDAQLLLNYITGLLGGSQTCDTDSPNLTVSDVNEDGATDTLDALLIAQCAEGISNTLCPEASEPPNILLVIADDMGIDATPFYDVIGTEKPNMPNLSQLANDGLIFDNAWSYALCSPTRASLLTGRHGFRTGVLSPQNPQISTSEMTLQSLLDEQLGETYAHSIVGKWHISSTPTDPTTMGVGHYAGYLSGSLTDYYSWPLTENGVTQTFSGYNTTKLTDLAIDWINEQDQPWFSWVAYNAPHAPFHLPPLHMHDRDDLPTDAASINANTLPYYLAMVESIDYEIGRLLDAIPEEERDNTVFIFIGDNGTPAKVVQGPYDRGKGSLRQGGVHVPMVISGPGVRQGREGGLVQTADLFATIAEIAGVDLPVYEDSYSFEHLLSETGTSSRAYNYSQIETTNDRNPTGYTVRDDQYKLIVYENGSEAFFDLIADPYETNDLLGTLTHDQEHAYDDLKAEIDRLYGISTPDPTPTPSPVGTINITDAYLTNSSPSCVDHAATYISDVVEIESNILYMGELIVSAQADTCTFASNAIPNHNFNDLGGFPNDVTEQSFNVTIPTTPQIAESPTALSLQYNSGIFLNGVKIDLIAAGCYDVGNIGCNDMSTPYRYDPMSPLNTFNVDSHNAHAQKTGEYHYHGNPNALFDDSDSSAPSPVIGFAADGFPIFGSYFDDNGTIRKAQPSYQLKSGTRSGGPGGAHDGRFIDDFEYVANSGDLDVCNGMVVDGAYGYYVTDTYPHILGCFSGTPDSSFRKGGGG